MGEGSALNTPCTSRSLQKNDHEINAGRTKSDQGREAEREGGGGEGGREGTRLEGTSCSPGIVNYHDTFLFITIHATKLSQKVKKKVNKTKTSSSSSPE